jgi:hypothetical protein
VERAYSLLILEIFALYSFSILAVFTFRSLIAASPSFLFIILKMIEKEVKKVLPDGWDYEIELIPNKKDKK